ncbi:uncharacterized protein TNCV_4964691 [Trichonephila clavipes]|nr:uncharacterized protein TNCV_4964691 [Trichonephila clavipes]
MDETVTTARDLELEVNEDDIEELIMGHEDDLTIEELQEILNKAHQETQRNVSPSEQEEGERGPMPTSAIKDLFKKARIPSSGVKITCGNSYLPIWCHTKRRYQDCKRKLIFQIASVFMVHQISYSIFEVGEKPHSSDASQRKKKGDPGATNLLVPHRGRCLETRGGV